MSLEKVFYSRSPGIPLEALKDQYADEAARTWNKFSGDTNQRRQIYKDFLLKLLRMNSCEMILDVACGTGIDSMMLLDEGFKVVSVDASDKMLKHALEARRDKRKDPKYEQWIIKEAKWETLLRDINSFLPGILFDAVICLGNSFAYLLDEHGDQRVQKLALRNFSQCLKPGGILYIDHRNYDTILETGTTPGHSIYYNYRYPIEVKTSVIVVGDKPELVAQDYRIDMTNSEDSEISEFPLWYYPHKLKLFTEMLDEAFDEKASHEIYADFKPLNEVPLPAFYIHIMKKQI